MQADPKPQADEKLDIVFFWKQNDTGIYGRRQDMLAKYLARHPRVHRLFHFDAPVDVRHWFRYPREIGIRRTEAIPVIRQTLARKLRLADTGNVRFDTFLHLDSRRAGFRSLFRLLGTAGSHADHVQRTLASRGLGDRRTVMWVCPTMVDFPEIRDRLRPDLVVADIIDDQRLWPLTEAERGDIERNYTDVLGGSDLAIANCQSVQRSMSHLMPEIHVVPNAAEVPAGAERWPKPAPLRRLNGPVIGYVGNLDAIRLDIDLVAELADRRPAWNLVFIGSARRDNPLRALARRDNVHLLGVRRYDEALRFIRHFDVAMVPHLDNELTRHMNPLKLYVYFSLRVPIVATPIANTDDMDEFVRVGGTPDEFIDAIEQCLADDPFQGAEQRVTELLRRNSWEERTARIMSLLEEALDRKLARGDAAGL